MMNPNYKTFWKTVLQIFGTERALFLDIEVEPEIGPKAWNEQHKIKAIGVADMYSEPHVIMGSNEEQILSDFQSFLYKSEKPLILVGYGIMYLDLPFLIYKCRQYGYRFKYLLRFLETTPVLDLTEAVSEYLKPKHGYKLWKLSELQELHGIDKNEFDKKVLDNQFALREYLKKDIEAIRNLYKFLVGKFFI